MCIRLIKVTKLLNKNYLDIEKVHKINKVIKETVTITIIPTNTITIDKHPTVTHPTVTKPLKVISVIERWFHQCTGILHYKGSFVIASVYVVLYVNAVGLVNGDIVKIEDKGVFWWLVCGEWFPDCTEVRVAIREVVVNAKKSCY